MPLLVYPVERGFIEQAWEALKEERKGSLRAASDLPATQPVASRATQCRHAPPPAATSPSAPLAMLTGLAPGPPQLRDDAGAAAHHEG